jgi:uncharacterized membrane protein
VGKLTMFVLIVLIAFTITYIVCRYFDERNYIMSGGKKPYWWTAQGLRATFYGSVLAWAWFIFILITVADFIDKRQMMKKLSIRKF